MSDIHVTIERAAKTIAAAILFKNEYTPGENRAGWLTCDEAAEWLWNKSLDAEMDLREGK